MRARIGDIVKGCIASAVACCTALSGQCRDVDGRVETTTDSATVEWYQQGLVGTVIDYINSTNKTKADKAFDFSVIAGPYYSIEKKLGIGVLAAGTFSTCHGDTLTPLSNSSVYVNASLSGYYEVGVEGNVRFKQDRFRFNYQSYFSSMPTFFWGMGYDQCSDNANKTSYLLRKVEMKLEGLARLADGFYAGALFDVTSVTGSGVAGDRIFLWRGEPLKTLGVAPGVKLSYDTRDNMTAPRRGVRLDVAQRFYPKALGNTNEFHSTELTLGWYCPAWRGCTVATRYHSIYTYGGSPSWSMMPTMGGSYMMRGYYEGRYRDRGIMDAIVELRQHLFWRIGAVAWGGGGFLFSSPDRIDGRMFLPNYGAGLRWEFKQNVNLRFDAGFGKGEWGVVFSINEAF